MTHFRTYLLRPDHHHDEPKGAVAMMPFFLVAVLAGFCFLVSCRQYVVRYAKRQCQPRVVVKGHTFTDRADDEWTQQPKRIQEVRRACFLSTGGEDVSALKALVLAERNPDVQFDIVNRDVRRIAEWNSDCIPVYEPGVDALLFDDAAVEEKDEAPYSQEVHRRRRLANVLFSTDVAGCIAAADMVFLGEDTDTNTIRTIAQVSTGHKVIVHQERGRSKAIRQRLDKAATASFDLIANPEFLVPGSIINDLLHPTRVVIGNLADKHSAEAAALLRKLYSWISPEHIITTDVWSAELGRIATNAILAQQSATIHALSSICSRTDASGPAVSQIVATDPRLVIRTISEAGIVDTDQDSLRKDVEYLVYLAQELGLREVAEYWLCVMRVNDGMNHRVAHRMASCLPDRPGNVALLGFSNAEGTLAGVGFVRSLVQRGIPVRIYDPYMTRHEILTTVGCTTGVTVMDDIDKTVSGCSAVVLHTDRGLDRQVNWEAVAGLMQAPRFFLDPFQVMENIDQYGFRILQTGRHYSRRTITM